MALTQLSNPAPTPFTTLMHLDKVDDSTYRSTCCAYEPGGNVIQAEGIKPRVYGGHFYAQSVWTAAQTVSPGFVCHNVSGNFIRGGLAAVPFIYKVTTLMDGRNFCMRSVDAVQYQDHSNNSSASSGSQSSSPSGPAVLVCRCTIAFKRHSIPTPTSDTSKSSSPSSDANQTSKTMQVQPPKSLSTQYASVLQNKYHPSQHPTPPSYDGPIFHNSATKYTGPPFPGLQSHMVDMAAYNQSRPALDRNQLHLYAIIGSMPSIYEAPNLHVCAHLYASDRNSLFTLTNLLGVQNDWKFMTTLTHHVIFHCKPEQLTMTANSGDVKQETWYAQEMWADEHGDERALFASRIWAWDQGAAGNRHVATVLQDGVMRLQFESEERRKKVARGLKRGSVL